MSCHTYRRLLQQYQTIFPQINPNRNSSLANCPEAADALNDFLNSGTIRSVRPGSGSSVYTLPRRIRWRTTTYQTIGNNLRNCNHIIVESTRPNEQRFPNHYFIVFKLDNNIHVADAFSHELYDGMDTYVENSGLSVQDVSTWTFRWATSEQYDIAVTDPLAGMDY